MKTKEKIMEFLQEQDACLKKETIAKKLDLKIKTVAKVLTELRKEKQIGLYYKKYWGISDDGIRTNYIEGIITKGFYKDQQFRIKIGSHSKDCEVKINNKTLDLVQDVIITLSAGSPTTMNMSTIMVDKNE